MEWKLIPAVVLVSSASGVNGQAYHVQLYGGLSFFQTTRLLAVPEEAKNEEGYRGFGFNTGLAFVWQNEPHSPGFGLGLAFEHKQFGTSYLVHDALYGSGAPLWTLNSVDSISISGKAEYVLFQLTFGTSPQARFHLHAGPVLGVLASSDAVARTERTETYTHNYIDSTYVVRSAFERPIVGHRCSRR
jgi:hypothetical protein